MLSAGLRVPGLQSGLELYIHGAGDLHVSRKIREEGIWEPYETSLLLQLLKPGHVFVDVGANIGYFSLLAASLVGETGAVFAFEPDPQNFTLLQASAEHNGLAHIVTALQAGLGEYFTFYNQERLHQSLDYRTPAEVYRPC